MSKDEKKALYHEIALKAMERSKVLRDDLAEEKRDAGTDWDMNSYGAGFSKGQIEEADNFQDMMYDMINDLDIVDAE